MSEFNKLDYEYQGQKMAEITFLFIHKARQWIENKEAVLPENAIPIHKNIALHIIILNII